MTAITVYSVNPGMVQEAEFVPSGQLYQCRIKLSDGREKTVQLSWRLKAALRHEIAKDKVMDEDPEISCLFHRIIGWRGQQPSALDILEDIFKK